MYESCLVICDGRLVLLCCSDIHYSQVSENLSSTIFVKKEFLLGNSCRSWQAVILGVQLQNSFFFRTTNLLLYPLPCIKIMNYSYSVFQPLLSKRAAGLWITHLIRDVWQNVEYGLRVKRKEKYLYIRKCNNINNSKKKNSGK